MIFNTRRTLLGFKPGTNEEVVVEYPGNVEQVLSHLDEVIDGYRRRQEGDEFSIHDAEILNALREARTAIGRAVDLRDDAESVGPIAPIEDLTDDEAEDLIDAISYSGYAIRQAANVIVVARPSPSTHRFVEGDERLAALHAFNTGAPLTEYTYTWTAFGRAYPLDPSVHRIVGIR